MSGPYDGGAAFPVPADRGLDGSINQWPETGMTYRAWVAGLVMAANVSSTDAVIDPVGSAIYAVRCADALIAELAKGGA